MRRTHTLVQVAAALAAAPDERHWGYQLSKRSGVRPGAMYPVLDRMLGEGWLADGWETMTDHSAKQRPPRRYYRLTEDGKTGLRALLDDARADPRFAALLAPNDSPFTHHKPTENNEDEPNGSPALTSYNSEE